MQIILFLALFIIMGPIIFYILNTALKISTYFYDKREKREWEEIKRKIK